MMALIMASAITLLAAQASIKAPRSEFVSCLQESDKKAESDKMALAGYSAYLIESCAGQADGLKKALISFDVKNGVARARATSDAQAQIDDYIATFFEDYQYRSEAMAGKPAAPAPQASPAAEPTPAQPQVSPAAAPTPAKPPQQ